MKYRPRTVVEATQWFKNGDHPEDNVFRPFEDTGRVPTEPREGEVVRYFRHPRFPGRQTCICGHAYHDHGFLDIPGSGRMVCPGDYVVTDCRGDRWVQKANSFDADYEPIPLEEGKR